MVGGSTVDVSGETANPIWRAGSMFLQRSSLQAGWQKKVNGTRFFHLWAAPRVVTDIRQCDIRANRIPVRPSQSDGEQGFRHEPDDDAS